MNIYKTNFSFLEDAYPFISSLGDLAERSIFTDASNTLVKLRVMSEKITDLLIQYDEIHVYDDNHYEKLKELETQCDDIPSTIFDTLHTIRKSGNIAAHMARGTEAEAKFMLRKMFYVCLWFYERYEEDVSIDYIIPVKKEDDSNTKFEELEKELQQSKEELQAERDKIALLKQKSVEEVQERKQEAYKKHVKLKETEAETRERIDKQLRDAGWECDTEVLNYKKQKTLPQKGRSMAIAEWKCGKLWADYALFIGFDLVGIVEAKRHRKDVRGDLIQAKNYSQKVIAENQAVFVEHPNSIEFKAPFVFATNGRAYLKQYETASGIWFWDARNNANIEKVLRGWYSPRELSDKLRYDENIGISNLEESSSDFLSDPAGLSLRDYQVEAIHKLEQHIIKNKTSRQALLAMATGTGKTRTMIGMCYRLIKSKTFKKILFLVDRTMLGKQAADSFKDVKIEGLQTFAQIYDLKNLGDTMSELDTKIHFATVQSLVKRIAYSDNPPTIGEYDCIVVDEAHRGYTLDKDMDDEELFLRDQKDYQSKYRMVLDHFDAYRIGLTATPAIHTKEVFGEPIFNYSYRRAVIEGHLIDFEPPYVFQTKLSDEGISWKKGDPVKIYDPEEGDIVEGDITEDEIHVDIKGFNKRVLTENFNQTVLKELVENPDYEVDIESKKKTLIFAASEAHADTIVTLLKKELDDMGVEVHHESVVKITGSVTNREDLLRRYKNELYPNIVVTVDLLTTGIDVPAICNLVFLRRVNSRILYDQMLGRATRKCPDVKKEVFKIIDCVGVTEVMSKENVMKPIAPSVSKSFIDLSEELLLIQDEERQQVKLDRIIAKLQRNLRNITLDQQEYFKEYAGESNVSDYGKKLKNLSTEDLKQEIEDKARLWQYLDKQKANYDRNILISDHEDQLNEVKRAYGKELQPKDYIESFISYIQQNRNTIQALNIVCTKPHELTRADLKKIRLILDAEGFSKTKLNTAFQHTTNEEIVADIISMIRTAALGTDLKAHDQRVSDAMNVIKQQKKFNSNQLKWLEKIEKQLLQEIIITVDDLDELPFSDEGGFRRIDKVFKGETKQLLSDLHRNLYA